MNFLEIFIFFNNYIFPIIILVFGLIGNTIGMVVILRSRLKSIGPTHIYCYMFETDSAYLVQIIITYLYNAFGMNLFTYSRVTCKSWMYINYSLSKELIRDSGLYIYHK